MVDLSTQGYPYLIFGWCLFAVTTPLVFVRLYVQLYYRARPWREGFVILAWLLYLNFQVCTSIFNDYDGFNFASGSWDPDSGADAVRKSTVGLKLNFAVAATYLIILYACKAAILCFYMDLCPRHVFPKLRWSIVVVWPLILIGVILKPIEDILATCRRDSDNWTWLPKNQYQCEPRAGSNFDPRWLTLSRFCFHIGTDLLVYLLPIVIVRKLTYLTSKQKRGAYAIFALGAINILSAIEVALFTCWIWYTYINKVKYDTKALLRTYEAQNFLYPFQAASAIMIICLPYCRPSLVRSTHRLNNMSTAEAPPPTKQGAGAVPDLEAAVQTTLTPSTTHKTQDMDLDVVEH